jgi:hypothetical protein
MPPMPANNIKTDFEFLNQLVKSLEDSGIKLEEAYKKGDSAEFNSTKSLMIKIYSQINEAIK